MWVDWSGVEWSGADWLGWNRTGIELGMESTSNHHGTRDRAGFIAYFTIHTFLLSLDVGWEVHSLALVALQYYYYYYYLLLFLRRDSIRVHAEIPSWI